MTRQMGPLTFIISLSKEIAQVEVTVKLRNVQLSGLILTAADPTVMFEIADGNKNVMGSMGAFFCSSPLNSRLLADFSVTNLYEKGKEATVNEDKKSLEMYRGDLVAWNSPVQRVLQEFSVFITPELEARVQVIDNSESGTPMAAQLTFYYGSQIVGSYLSMSTVTMVKIKQVSMGNIEINEGGIIHFRQATALQTGQLHLNVTVSTLNPPSTVQYNGVLGEWSWINGRAGNCRRKQ